MKVALLNGQDHRGSTYQIGRQLAEELTDSSNIQELFFPRDLPKFCTGCTSCIIRDETLCPHLSYMERIKAVIDSADVLIFTTPVYVYHATGSMKALLDHFAYRWMVHRPEAAMFSKQAVCISTAAGGGMKSACRDIKDSLSYWGVSRIYCYGVAVRATAWSRVRDEKKAQISHHIKELAGKIRRRSGNIRPSVKTKLLFYMMRLMQKKADWNPADVAYWQQRGWLEKARPWHKEQETVRNGS